jgi:hypothetical protein
VAAYCRALTEKPFPMCAVTAAQFGRMLAESMMERRRRRCSESGQGVAAGMVDVVDDVGGEDGGAVYGKKKALKREWCSSRLK